MEKKTKHYGFKGPSYPLSFGSKADKVNAKAKSKALDKAKGGLKKRESDSY